MLVHNKKKVRVLYNIFAHSIFVTCNVGAAQRKKMISVLYKDNYGPDQPAHSHKLKGGFITCLQNQRIQ